MAGLYRPKTIDVPGILPDNVYQERLKQVTADQQATAKVAPPPNSAVDMFDRIRDAFSTVGRPPVNLTPRNAPKAAPVREAAPVPTRDIFPQLGVGGELSARPTMRRDDPSRSLGELTPDESQAETERRVQVFEDQLATAAERAKTRAALRRQVADERAENGYVGLGQTVAALRRQVAGERAENGDVGLGQTVDPNEAVAREDALDAARVGRAADRLAQEQAALDQPALQVKQAAWLNALQVGGRAAVQTFTGVARFPAIVWEEAAAAATGTDPDQRNAMLDWLDSVDASFNELLPGDMARQKDLMTELAQGAGSYVAFLTTAAALQMAGVPPVYGTMAIGAASEGTQVYYDAVKHGASAWQRMAALLAGSGLGLSEALPISRLLSRVEQQTGGAVTRLLVSTAASSMEEFMQELGQAVGEDVIAKLTYDTAREADVGTWLRRGRVGGIIGGGAHLGVSAVAGIKGKPRTVETQTTGNQRSEADALREQVREHIVQREIAAQQAKIDAAAAKLAEESAVDINIDVPPAEPVNFPTDTTVDAEVAAPIAVEPVAIPPIALDRTIPYDGGIRIEVSQPATDPATGDEVAVTNSMFVDADSAGELTPGRLRALIDMAAEGGYDSVVTVRGGKVEKIVSAFDETTLEAAAPQTSPAFDAYMEGVNAPTIKGRGGTIPVDDNGMVPLTHWSNERRDVLDPRFAGTGPVRGVERQRLGNAAHGTAMVEHEGGPPARIYYGVNAVEGLTRKDRGAIVKRIGFDGMRRGPYVKETGLGDARHRVLVDPNRLYNWYEDPLGLRAQIDRGTPDSPRPGSEVMNEYERRIRDAGFDGYYVGDGELGQAVAMFTAETPLRDDVVEPDAYETVSPARANELARQIPGLRGVLRYVTPEERARITKQSAQRLVDMFTNLPSAQEMAAVAIAGRAKKGWYADSARAIVDIFGVEDAPRFTALLAALSPQNSVQMNAQNALSVWAAWVRAGRPTERARILAVMATSITGTKGEGSILPAWIDNTVRALSTPDATTIRLSGPKVNSFMLNLQGVTNEVTADAWMANYAALDASAFKGRTTAADDGLLGKSPGYIAHSARVRQAAEAATKLTGETWTPAEIQETVWSWAKAAYEAPGSAVDMLKAGGIPDEVLTNVPDFAALFSDGVYARILQEAGYDPSRSSTGRGKRDRGGSGPATGTRPALDAEAHKRHLVRAARRLDALRAARGEQKVETRRENVEAARVTADTFPGDIPSEPGIGKFDLIDTYDFANGDVFFMAPQSSQRLDPLPGLPDNSSGPVASVVAAAKAYAASAGLPFRRQARYVTVDVERAKRIAAEYDAMEHRPNDPAVRKAYDAMIEETLAQYQAVKAIGLEIDFIEPGQPDPYPEGPRQVLDDLQAGHLWVFPTDDGFGSLKASEADNPLLRPTDEYVKGRRLLANDVFRIVHDFFGHGLEGAGFGARGEENAWQAHIRLYSEAARPAVTSETRGQNSWVNYGPHGDKNRADPKNTTYADQKTGLLPSWTWREGIVDDDLQTRLNTPVTSIDAFNAADLAETLQRPGWAILTAMQEGDGDAASPKNRAALAKMQAEFRDRPTIAVEGMYKGEAQGRSWVILATEEEALRLARAYNQESILTNRGLVYSDGRLTPAVHDDTTIGANAELQDFFSVLPDGTAFSMGLDFGGVYAATFVTRRNFIGERSRKPVPAPRAGQQGSAVQVNPSADSLSQIGTNLKNLMGTTVRQTRFPPGHSNAVGLYFRSTDVIRLINVTDLTTLAHEVGHKFHMSRNGNTTAADIDRLFVKPNSKALQALARATYPGALKDASVAEAEGFAELFRMYVLSRSYAQRRFPQLVAALDQHLRTKVPAMAEGLDAIGVQYEAWLNMPSNAIVRSMVAPTDTGTIRERMADLRQHGVVNWMRDFARLQLQHVVNRQQPLNQLVIDMLQLKADRGGGPLELRKADDPRVMARLARNAGARAHIQLTDGVIPYRGIDPASASLQQAIFRLHEAAPDAGAVDIDPERMADFDAYLVTLRGLAEYKRMEEGKLDRPPLNASKADLRQARKDYEAKYGAAFVDAAAMVDDYARALWTKAYDAGLMGKQAFEGGLDKDFYAPLLRDMSDRNLRPKQGAEIGGRPIVKRFGGSDRDIISPMAALMSKTYSLEATIAHNETIRMLAKLADNVGQAGEFVERIPSHQLIGRQYTTEEIVRALMKDSGITNYDAQDLLDFLMGTIGVQETATLFRSEQASTRGENILFFWENGKLSAIQIKDGDVGADIVDLIAAVGHENMGWGMDALAMTSGMFRTAITSWPDYLAVNYIRDQPSAWILTDVGYKPFVTGIKGITEELRQHDWARRYNAAYGIMGGMNTAAMHDTRVRHDINALGAKGYTAKVFADGNIRGIARATALTETGTRVGIFEKAFLRAKGDGLTDYQAAIEASYTATDYIDFGLNGDRMLVARRLIPFLNAQLQGLYKMMRTLGGDEVRQRLGLRYALTAFFKDVNGLELTREERMQVVTGRKAWLKMGVLGIISAALHFLFKDDEDYQEASEYLRTTGWVIPLGGQTLAYIPKPFELALIANAMERGLEAAYGDEAAGARFLRGLAMTLSPPTAPPAVQTVVEHLANYSFFSGREIVPFYMKGLDASLQYTEYTSEIAKLLNRLAPSMSPLVIDHYLTNMGASAYRDMVFMTNLMNPERKLPNVTDIPILRRFYRDTRQGSASARDFWRQASLTSGHLSTVQASYKQMVDAGRAAAARDYLQGFDEDTKAYALLNTHFDTDAKRLSPFYRTRQIMTIVSGLRRELNSGIGVDDTTLDSLTSLPKGLLETPRYQRGAAQKRRIDNALQDIARREVRNTLIAMGTPGWSGKKPLPAETSYDVLAAVDPELAEELQRRIDSKDVYSAEFVSENWPEVRGRVIADGEQAYLDDLVTVAKALK